jgi:hypothetical protein
MFLPQSNNKQAALSALKSRFVRVPAPNGITKFKDLITGIEQSGAYILAHYYRDNGGDFDTPPEYLVECLNCIYGDGFVPGRGPILEGNLLNLWKPSKIQPSGKKVTAADVVPFIDYLKRLFPNELERKYFTWWISHVIRNPHQRILATPVLRSQHGVGKGFLAESILSELVGESSVTVCALKDVVGDFNDVVEGKTLILIDEVYRSKKSTTDTLKAFQGNQTFALRRKYKPTITIRNYVNFIITSNDHIPLILEKDDRRFWVPAFIKHKESKEETDYFINEVFKPWLTNNGYQLVRDYLEQIDLTAYRYTAPPPSTVSKQEMLGFSMTDRLTEMLTEIVDSSNVLTTKWLRSRFTSSFDEKISDVAIANALLGMGCQRTRSNTQRYYITPRGLAAGLSDVPVPTLDKHLPSPFS